MGPAKLIQKSKDFPKDGTVMGEGGGNEFFINSPINTSTYNLFFGLS